MLCVWLGATAALAAIFGDSTAPQFGSAIPFIIL